jgi:hypothetical protein
VTVGIILLLREYRIYQSKGVVIQTMPGDSDISHAVEDRLTAIEARLDALDGGASTEEGPTVDQPDVIDPQPKESEAEVTPYSSRTKKT